MSIHSYNTADGTRWQVRWREGTGRVRTRVLTSKREAIAFDADVKARKYKGDALPQAGRQTLAAAYDEWWRLRGSTKGDSNTAHIPSRVERPRARPLRPPLPERAVR